jgi:phosphoglycerate kinase
VAGSKYDTKIGPLSKIYETVDNLLLGGVVYNAYLCAKYGVKINGVADSDVELAKGLVKQDEQVNIPSCPSSAQYLHAVSLINSSV